MMERLYNLLYFSDNEFYAYTPDHLFMIVAVLITFVLFVRCVRGLNEAEVQKLKRVMLVLLLFQQVALYSWYFVNAKFDVIDALPCYPCRLWQICAILYLLTGKREFFAINFLMGIPSSVLAFAIPDTSSLGFPNVMFIQFCVGHMMLILVPTMALICDRQRIEEDMLKICMVAYVVYISIAKLLNGFLGSNYGYVSKPPYNNVLFDSISKVYLLVYMVFAFTTLVLWFQFSKKMSRKMVQR